MKPPYPMLAKPGTRAQLATAVENGYVIEPKVDGVRCLAVLDEHGVHLYNRKLRDITAAFPDVCELIHKHTYANTLLGRLVLDGEIYVPGPSGHADFQLVQTRANRVLDVDNAAALYPAKYVAFDVLTSGAVDYTDRPLCSRNSVLKEICRPLVVPDFTQDEADRMALLLEGEGVVLKRLDSAYEPGARSPAWLKVKWLREVECHVGGVTHGIGKREHTFGGLLVGVYRPGDSRATARLTYIGTVGTGFDNATLEHLRAHFDRIRTTTNPFAETGTDWDLMTFVAPTTRIKVRFQEYTRDGILRFPAYVGLVE